MNKRYSIGVDLGGTNLRVAAYEQGTDFLDVVQLPTRLGQGRDQVVRDMCEAISGLIGRGYGDWDLVGIGVGSPGPLELPSGILRKPPNLHGWDGFNLRQAIETTLGRTVSLENDANLAALAEQRLGSGKTSEVDSLCVLTLGTGIGSGLVLQGKVWQGFSGMGGEAGHIVVVEPNGAPCGCGGAGCLEQYASATAVLRLCGELMGSQAPDSCESALSLAAAREPQALRVFETVGRALAVGLAGLINTLNLPLYAIGGGLSKAWDVFAPVMFAELHRRSYVYRLTEPDNRLSGYHEQHKTHIQVAELGSTAGLLGACLLPFDAASVLTEGEQCGPE